MTRPSSSGLYYICVNHVCLETESTDVPCGSVQPPGIILSGMPDLCVKVYLSSNIVFHLFTLLQELALGLA